MFLILHCPHSLGEIQGDKLSQCNVKHNRLPGNIAIVLPAGCPHSVGVIVGNCWTKLSKSPLFPVALGTLHWVNIP